MKRAIAKAKAIDTTQGVRPAMQARSLRKRYDLMKAGRKLLHHRVLEEIPIKQICAEADCTVGSFYSRFEDKASYFDALIAESCQEMLNRAEEAFDLKSWEGVSPAQIADQVVCFLIDLFQGEYSSILTEAFLRESKGGHQSTPMRDVGYAFINTVGRLLLPYIPTSIHPDPLKGLAFGLQVIYGSLHNARLRDAGPIAFHSTEFEQGLCLMFKRYLGL